MAKDKSLILTMTTENRCLSVSQQHSTDRYSSSNLKGPIKADSLWQTLLVVTVLRLSEEIHVILNRFYIAQVIIILSDFADILAWFAHEACEVPFSSTRGQTLSNICMCVHVDLL